MGYCSVISLLRPVAEKDQIEDGHGHQRAGEDAEHVADGLLARLGAEHVARLDVHEQVRGVAGDFGGDRRGGQVGA